jgi:hypothetical protein
LLLNRSVTKYAARPSASRLTKCGIEFHPMWTLSPSRWASDQRVAAELVEHRLSTKVERGVLNVHLRFHLQKKMKASNC